MTITLADLKQRLLDRVDPDQLVDLLGISTEQLVAAFEDDLDECYDKLVKELYTNEELEEEDYHTGE